MIAFDTNILVYVADVNDDGRRERALAVFTGALRNGNGFLPLHVLGEFLHVARRKLRRPVSEVRALVESWCAALRTAPYGLDDLDAALLAHERHGLQIWDALIWAVCDRLGATILVTEDLQDGRTLGRVTFLDPFNPINAKRLGIA